ncbi:hypothetical protein H632_c5130p0, partial [Helicosporidium sp. ATCC 50920]
RRGSGGAGRGRALARGGAGRGGAAEGRRARGGARAAPHGTRAGPDGAAGGLALGRGQRPGLPRSRPDHGGGARLGRGDGTVARAAPGSRPARSRVQAGRQGRHGAVHGGAAAGHTGRGVSG